ncbi:hypothetical protein PN498_23215 [Oscillatoria sp. CS-180]|uniref:hypothetical protein n=1 Tax=Oscillatoria sp. CS-180 TaxID=3021720 RepID=UPI0023308BA0|nr:hypothetical protein [Oscillatoria sp. CS-180]MDB9528922.1 hypothetical protein [Oscillatoria sp. CS-180]
MSNDLTTPKSSLGDRIRQLTQKLRQESEIQAHATARVLGAAAAIAQNQDALIDEVVDMVEDDLETQAAIADAQSYTVEALKQQFEDFATAKAHFNLKARSWAALVNKLNQQAAAPSGSTPATPAQAKSTQQDVVQKLEAIDAKVDGLRADMNQVVQLLTLLVEKELN